MSKRITAIHRAIFGWVHRIGLGSDITSKLRILGAAILDSANKITKKRAFCLYIRTNAILERLWLGTVIKVDGMKYALVDYEGFQIVASHRDLLSQDPGAEVYTESFVLTWLKPKIGDVFVDIGAHIGKYALSVGKLVGKEGAAIAIEPHPLNFQTLVKNVRLNKLENVSAYNLAAWNSDCDLKLFVGNVAGHHSIKEDGRLGWVKVKARVMDKFFKELGLNRIDWVKIDVEGAEWEVLLGLTETLKVCRPRIIIEVFNGNTEKVKIFMKKHEYGLVRISPFFGAITYFFCFPISF